MRKIRGGQVLGHGVWRCDGDECPVSTSPIIIVYLSMYVINEYYPTCDHFQGRGEDLLDVPDGGGVAHSGSV